MKKFVFPDFEHSNVNVSATLAEFLGAPNGNATLTGLKKELSKGYKNVVFICFDGLGAYPLKKNLKKTDFLRRHVEDMLTSTFPSTTTNATTSLTTNRLPLEHGWFGWSLHFEKEKRNVDIFLNSDSWTGEKLASVDSPLARYPHYFDEANCDYEINTVFPPYVKVAHPERNVVYDFDVDRFFEDIKNICKKDGKQFVYAYNNEPDHSMHENGVTCKKTKELIRQIDRNMEKLASETENTLFIVTADHGMIDVKGYVYLYEDKKLMDMLKVRPYLEARAVSFAVKEEEKSNFEKYFSKKYGKHFKLFTAEELIKKGCFGGKGDKGYLLGDYVAVGTYTHKVAMLSPNAMKFKGHHTSLTEEMLVPLILIKN